MDVPKPVHTSVSALETPTTHNCESRGVLVNTIADAWCKSLHHETSVCGRGEAYFASSVRGSGVLTDIQVLGYSNA